MIWSHLETYSNKCAPLNVAPHADTMAPLLGIELRSSPLAKQFYQLGEPIHNLICDPSLMYRQLNTSDMSIFIIVDINDLGKIPLVSIRLPSESQCLQP